MTAQLDAIVIGAGIAGLTAATRLAEEGLRFLVLEKGTEEKYPCNTRIAGGVFHVAHRDIAESPEIIFDAIKARTGENVDDELVHAYAGGINEAVSWLKTCGVRYIKVGQDVFRRHTLAPPIKMSGRDYWHGRGGDALLKTLETALNKRGGAITRGARALRLLTKNERVEGVVANVAGVEQEFRCKAVIICDGGFQGDDELVRKYITPQADQVKQRNTRSGAGDGLRMAVELGAKVVAPHRFYGHVLSADAFNSDDFWPFPILDHICVAGVIVGKDGNRLLDEGLGGVKIVNALSQLDEPASTYVVYDRDIWEGPGREFLPPANPTLENLGGTILKSDSLEGLAQQMGVPVEALKNTVAQHNTAVANGSSEDLTPKRSIHVHIPHVIKGGPFHAVRICAGLTYTMGGIGIDKHCRVVRDDNSPIEGLYAAGCATGGLEGGENVAYLGGLTKSTFTAYRAVETITEKAAALA